MSNNNAPGMTVEEEVVIESADDIGSTIRIMVRVKGIMFKRLWHKSGLYRAVWDDADQYFGTIDLRDKSMEDELESIFKAYCLAHKITQYINSKQQP